MERNVPPNSPTLLIPELAPPIRPWLMTMVVDAPTSRRLLSAKVTVRFASRSVTSLSLVWTAIAVVTFKV